MNREELGKKISQLIARCWADEGFKKKLLADANATLTAEGESLPAGLSLKVVENTDKVFHLVIPRKPTDLSEEDLDRVSGGDACGPKRPDKMRGDSERNHGPPWAPFGGCEPNNC